MVAVQVTKTVLRWLKNKCSPFRTAEFDIMYGEGIFQGLGRSWLGVWIRNNLRKVGHGSAMATPKLGQGRDPVKRFTARLIPNLLEETRRQNLKEANQKQ